MNELIKNGDGNTPLSPDELADLLPTLATREELNEWERENILHAREWALNDRTTPLAMLTDEYVRKLHARMFGDTWRWAGRYRKTEKNIGIPVYQIRESLVTLLGDSSYWIERQIYTPDEIGVRFHHRLVVIHPFPNGNGRHARLMADLLVMKLGRPTFTWGSADLIYHANPREKYLEAMRAADAGEIGALLEFARS